MWNRLLLLKAQLLGHEGIRRYGANTAWLMGEKVLRMFMGLFVGIWVARYLGPEQFGLLSYAQSFVFLFTAIATLGLDSIVVRELVKDNSQRNVLLGTAFTLKLIGSLCILPLLWLGVQFTSNDSYTNLLIFIIASGTIFQSFNVIDFYYQSSVLSKYVAFANTITLAISSIVKVVLILNEASLLAFAVVGVFDTVILALGLIYFYWQKTHHSLREWQFDKVVAKRLLADSWPLILSSMVIIIQARIDQIMLKEMIGNQEVGYYSAGMRLIEAFGFIPVVLMQSLYPAIQNARSTSITLYHKRLLSFYRLNFALFLLVAIPLYLFAEAIVSLLYGEEFKRVGGILSLLSIRLFFANMGTARDAFIISESLFKYSMVAMIIGTITNIIANYFLIPTYESKGAIIATILSFTVTTFIVDYIYNKTRVNVMLQLRAMFSFYKINKNI